MTESDQAQRNLLDFVALGGKLNDLIQEEAELERLRSSHSDADALVTSRQRVAVLADQMQRIRNSLMHSSMKDVVERITSPNRSTLEALRDWERLQRYVVEATDLSDAVRRISQSGDEVDEIRRIEEMTKEIGGIREAQQSIAEMKELQRAQEALRFLERFRQLK